MSRTRVTDFVPESISDVPGLALDGSSNGLDADENGDVYLQPRSIFRDPFRGGDHLLVLCDSFVTEVIVLIETELTDARDIDLAKTIQTLTFHSLSFLSSLQIAAIDANSGVLIRPLGTRAACADVIAKAEALGAAPLFGCEQEYFSGHWPHEHLPNPATPLMTPPNEAGECHQHFNFKSIS